MILYQPQNGYCYNTDTFVLYDFISRFNIKGNVLEVGGGCGILGLLLKRDFPGINMDIIEKQDIMAEFIKKNSEANNINVSIINEDFLDFKYTEKYDFVVSNPPFYNGSLKSNNEIKKIARYEEFLPMDKFFHSVNILLKERGEFIFCYDAKRIDDIILKLPKPLKITDIRFFHPKLNKKATLVLVKAKRHSKSFIKIYPPFIGFVGDEYSDEAKKMYKKANTKSIKI